MDRKTTAYASRAPRRRGARHTIVCLAAIALACALLPPAVRAGTTTTRYRYNADGALTAITKDVGGSSETTTYLTWDDFVPDVNDPSTGTVQLGNGTLDEYGPNPGAANAAASFTFDARDRLVGYSGAGQTESYQYDAGGMLASSTTGGDALQFYFDASPNAVVTNIHHPGTGLWSAYLGGVRYLSDGAQQVLLSPRKDTACAYTPQEEKLQSYVYDAFGAQSAATLPRQYDLHENPFQYTGEYRDPLWGGYYLRARWYHPDLPTFISRDPTEQLNRYGYGGGDPANMVDPGGTNFFHALGRDLRAVNAALNRGVGGHFARFFLAPILAPLQIAAEPKAFWEAVKHDKGGIDIFLALGVVTEAGWGLVDSEIVFRGLAVSMQQRFLGRAALDSVLGFGQSIAAGGARGFKHFDWGSFASGAEMTLGTIDLWRGVGSLNIQSGYGFTPQRAAAFAGRRLANEADDTALIFRVRTRIGIPYTRVSPAQEWLRLGAYHERLIAVTKDDFYSTQVVGGPTEQGIIRGKWQGESLARLARQPGRFEFVGKVEDFTAGIGTRTGKGRFLANPRMLKFRRDDEFFDVAGMIEPKNPKSYNLITNNCHDHAFAILEGLGLRRSLRSYFW
jgi:RHS repeat-associated protein